MRKLIQFAVSGKGVCCLWGMLFLTCGLSARGDATWVYSVQISATVQVSPPQITLNWEPDMFGADSYTVYRKAKNDTSWGSGMSLPGWATSFTDFSVSVGSTYEYQIIKDATLGYIGTGYIFTGINAPLTENRGKVILVVASESVVGLASELARLQSDLVGDGWQVVRRDVSSNDSPAYVRSVIQGEYWNDPGNVNTVFLFGHVPVLQSGILNYDGHLDRPMPADAYYGDMVGDWSSSPSYLPANVTLMVGRVDMFNMPGVGAPSPWPSEVELLRQYLNKDHNWRQKIITAQRRALVGDLRGGENGLATAASGYRAFEPLVGPGNTLQSGVTNDTPPEERWISMLTNGSYLCAFACGAGQPTAVSGMGLSDGTFYDVRSIDVVAQDAKAMLVMAFGSWFGNWDDADDLLRSFLATPTMGLAACLSGEPHWFFHHLGLGETLGYSTRLTMNNSTLYESESNTFTRAVYIALMGDPTLRIDQLAPPSGLNASASSNTVALSWSASPDSALGYHVYRAASPSGPFVRVTGNLVATTSFSDANLSPGTYTYMVRAVNVENHFSGSYSNMSQGVFATVTVSQGIVVTARKVSNGVALSWNSQPETTYHVLGKNSLTSGGWLDLSGDILSGGATTSWTDTNANVNPQRFYRISSP